MYLRMVNQTHKRMYSFTCDYSEGAHPNILKKLQEENYVQHPGYGEDEVTNEAIELIRQRIGNPKANVYFVIGGTQANMAVISALLRSPEAVICVEGGHIFAHETGAIEATGHRVITVPGIQGKLTTEGIEKALDDYFMRPHMVKPAMVYISDATEVGTIYTKAELQAISEFCRSHKLLLYLDGARLGSALTSDENDLTLHDLTELTDVFYIGGTKNGALLGEAIVFNDPNLYPDFDYVRKERGALLAKGWSLGVQFGELFKDDLYFKLARHANVLAKKLSAALKNAGYDFLADSPTNQVFPIVTKSEMAILAKKYIFEEWQPIDNNHSAIRFVTSWATDEAHVDELIKDCEALRQ